MNDNKKNIGKLIISILLFFYLATIVVLIVRGVGIPLNGGNNLHLVIIDFTVSGLLSVILILMYLDLIKDGIKKISLKYGKNSLIRASNLLPDSTAIERNKKIGGHAA